jgi:RNA polymerase sigma-70 factor (ECF subfamily)
MSAAAASPASAAPVASDQHLVAGMVRGDRESIGALYDLHAPVMMAVAVKMLGAHREAQDLVHDVFLEAWLHAGDYDPAKGSLRSWLMLRLRSRALDRLGKAEVARTQSLEECVPPVAGSSLAPAFEEVDRIGLREVIDRLDAPVREVLERTYFRGLTALAIAEEMGMPEGTVRSRLARGLRELRAALEHPEGGPADE